MNSQTWLSIKRIRKSVKQSLCFWFNCHCATHTHTGFLFMYIYIERERERVGKILKLRICIWNWEIKNKTSRKINVKLKYEIFLQWNTKFYLVFLVFHWRKFSYFNFTYIFALVLLFISQFHMHILKLARWFLLILKS